MVDTAESQQHRPGLQESSGVFGRCPQTAGSTEGMGENL